MRKTANINGDWYFLRDRLPDGELARIDTARMERLSLPHTWNALDGQDGYNDYYRGVGTYQKELYAGLEYSDKRIFIEFRAVNSVCEVFINGALAGTHAGGYSAFRFDITSLIRWGENNVLAVRADNTVIADVYPLWGDFTFYGGIYRDVNLIVADDTHFELLDYGSDGIYVSSELKGDSAEVVVRARVVSPDGYTAEYVIRDALGVEVAAQAVDASREQIVFEIDNPRLWNGLDDPHMYTLDARLHKDDETADRLAVSFGIRSLLLDADRGFLLNGKKYPIYGVSKHQGNKDTGWAVTKAQLELDAAIIKELGATAVRLAHYQHDRYFYELCDEAGFIVSAETPFMSVMSESGKARENALNQLTELILQNYNHPCICFWNIWNEIQMDGERNVVYERTRELNEHAKKLDHSRLTTCANVFYTKNDSPLNRITDGVGGNQYCGWYYGTVEDLDGWLDSFRRDNPKAALALSEYGTEGVVRWHSDTPQRGDYSEEYHTLYHEKSWAIIKSKPYIWGSFIWSMFEFAADSRVEGGEYGINHKGLVTFDRKVKKDAFYFYKAQWSKEEFVHITSRRYRNRAAERVDIKVFSNSRSVSLEVNGESLGEKFSSNGVFVFEGACLRMGDNLIAAVSCGGRRDEITLTRIEKSDESYVLKEKRGEILNWFGRSRGLNFGSADLNFSINDDVDALLDDPRARAVVEEHLDAKQYETLRGISLKMALIIRDAPLSDADFRKLNEELTGILKAGCGDKTQAKVRTVQEEPSWMTELF